MLFPITNAISESVSSLDGPKCEDFVQGNKIMNNTGSEQYLLLYQCNQSNTIKATLLPGVYRYDSSNMHQFMNRDLLCLYVPAVKEGEFSCENLEEPKQTECLASLA